MGIIISVVHFLFQFSDDFDVRVLAQTHALERMDERNLTTGEIQSILRKSFLIFDKEEGSNFEIMIRSKKDDVSLVLFPIRFEKDNFRIVLKTIINDGEAWVTPDKEKFTHVYDV